VLLAGDAAGFVDPFTGQGIALALFSGREAANAVAGVRSKRVAQTVAWNAYASRVRSALSERSRMALAVSAMLRIAPLARRAANVISRFPERARPLIDAVGGGGKVPSSFEMGRDLLRILR
jgi:flavin-dependent dehydrogenase